MSEENAPQMPETDAQRVAEIARLINESHDIQPGEAGDRDAGGSEEAPVAESPGSRSGELVEPQSEANESVDEGSEGDQAQADSHADEPITLKRLAEHLEIDDADLYDVEVPISGSESVTLGQLKDNWKEFGPAAEYRKQTDDKRNDFERQVLQTRAELNQVMSLIPEAVRGRIIEEARGRQQHFEKQQEQMVLEAIPDWQDADKRATDRAQIVADGAEYGFSEQEITYTQDARTLRMLRDFSRMKRELEGLRTAAKKDPGKASRPAKAASNGNRTRLAQLMQRGRQAHTMQGKAGVVSELIRNQK